MAQARQPIDLRTVGAHKAGATSPPEPEPEQSFEAKPYDPAPERENVRGRIALLLIWTLVGVIAFVVLSAIYSTLGCLKTDDGCSKEVLDLSALRIIVELVLTPLVGLVGAVTGFYFGEKTGSPAPADENA
jgi:hypothetical protein